MDPRCVSTVSEAPSHEGSGEVGGDTLKTGFLSVHPNGKSAESELFSSGYADSMEADINSKREGSFNFSPQSSPKVDDCSNIAGSMSPGVDPITLNACSVSRGDAPSRACQQELPLLGRECNPDDFGEQWASGERDVSGEFSTPGQNNQADGVVSFESTLPLTNDNDPRVESTDPEGGANSVHESTTTDTKRVLINGDEVVTKSGNQTNINVTEPKLNCQQVELHPSSTAITEAQERSSSTQSTVTNLKKCFLSNSQESQLPTSECAASQKEADTEDEDVVFDFSTDESNDLKTVERTDCSQPKFSKESCLYLDDQHCAQLVVNLREMRRRDLFCDVVIRIQDHLYKAHKCVLAANCSVLQMMIKENAVEVLDLSEIVNSNDAFESILEYLYSGEISVSMSTASDILAACKKLGIANVSRCCFLHIEKNINVDTWAHILDLSMNYDYPDVAQKVVRYFADNLRHLHKVEEAMYLSDSQLEQILNRSNHRQVTDTEFLKLDLALHWVNNDYDNRSLKLPRLLQFINIGLLTKEGLERVFGQRTLKHSDIFQDEMIKRFISDVRASLIARKKTQQLVKVQRKSSQTVKVSKRGRPRKIIDYNQTDDSSIDVPDPDEEEYVPDLSLEPVVVLKKKRGRPPKTRDVHGSSMKRRRGRPKKYESDKIHILEGKQIKEENMDCSTNEMHLLSPETRVKSECGLIADTSLKMFTSKVKRKSWSRSIPNPDGHICLICGKKFALRKQLTRHAVIHREKTKLCDLCDYKTTRNDKVRDHIRRVHVEEAVKRGLLSAEEFKRRQTMEANKPRLHRPRKSKIKRLLETGSAEEMVHCPKCPRKFTSVSVLRHHMKGHGSDTPFLCEICGFTTKHFASINVHKRQHNGKKFRCTFPGCAYENIRKSRLDDHISAHTGIKNHVCSICGKAFAGRKHMQRHEKTHLEIKPLKCEHCEYATTRRDKLRDHIRKHHRNIAISMGILDPNKIEDPKELKPVKGRKQKKKRLKCEKQQESNLLIGDTVEQLIEGTADSSVGVSRQDVDQVANFVTMAVPSHLLGVTTSTISEDVIQYLASMTQNGTLTGSHSQIHPSLAVPVTAAPSVQNTQSIQGVPFTQASTVAIHAGPPPPPQEQQQLMRTQNVQQVAGDRGDTWIYHIIPDGQHQYS